MSTVELLSQVPLFSLLDDQERSLLAERVETVTFSEGQTIFNVGDPGDSMYIVTSGEVELSVKTKTGEQMFLESPGPGEFFGEIIRNAATRNANEEAEDNRSRVMRVADWIAGFSGSLPFLFMHIVSFALWIMLNVNIFPFGGFDPFPFGFLTLVVSLEAIILSVFVLLSQNRQVARDKVRGDIEYDVNLKAEMQISNMHEKFDTIYSEILKRLDRIERKQ